MKTMFATCLVVKSAVCIYNVHVITVHLVATPAFSVCICWHGILDDNRGVPQTLWISTLLSDNTVLGSSNSCTLERRHIHTWAGIGHSNVCSLCFQECKTIYINQFFLKSQDFSVMQNTFLTQIFEKTRYLFRIFQYRLKRKYTPES